MKTVAALAALGVAAAVSPNASELASQNAFTDFVKTYNKEYTTEEVFTRYGIFKDNLAAIQQHNSEDHSYTMGMNEFGDMTWEEFHDQYTGYINQQSDFIRSMNAPEEPAADFAPAAALDWRTKGAVSPVKNQGQCGSCWAFSTVGSLEGVYEIAGNPLTQFSEQQLVDCSRAQGNQGCNGGLMDNAFEYIIKNGGICKEADYPYTAQDGTCKASSCTAVKAPLSSYKDVTKGSETALMTAINLNPVSIAIEADQSGFQFYSGGVFSGPCGKQLDHGVTLVGYGTDTGKDYWIVKNSWGASWGEQGYIRLVRGQDQCGLADAASYPIH